MTADKGSGLRAKSITKTSAAERVIREIVARSPASILIVGCGTGQEAGVLARSFQAETIGIDICDEATFDRKRSAAALLLIGPPMCSEAGSGVSGQHYG